MSQIKQMKEAFQETAISKLMIIAFVGLLVGFASSKTLIDDENAQSYCDKIESSVIEKRNFSGNLACFQPGIVDVNLTEEVEKNSRLKCVCRHSYKGFVQIIPISVSN